MYKVLVVDDEKHIRYRVTQFFPWGHVGFEVVGSAGNGREALEMVKHLQPHAVITDVLMPEMTGIELAKELNFLYPEIKVIMLSAYDDFKYVQEAIRYGVKGYLLKPLSKNDFLDTFSKLKEELNREAYLKKINIRNNEMLYEELLVLDLINGTSMNEIDRKLLAQDSRVVIFPLNRIFRINTLNTLKQIISEQSFHFWKQSASLSCLYGNSIVVIVNGKLASSKVDLIHFIEDYLKLLDACMKEIGAEEDTIIVGAGNPAKGIDEIKRSYNEAIYAYSYTFFYECASMIFFEDLPVHYMKELHSANQTQLNFALNNIEYRLMEAILQRDSKNISLLIEGYFRDLKSKLGLNIADIRSACTELIIVLTYLFKEKGYEPFTIEIEKVLEKIYLIDSLTELKNWLINLLEKKSNEIEASNANKENQYVLKAKEYVHNNYKKKITLSEVSETLYLHQAYFSAIFKEETGQNFIDYVNEIRVQKAAELLRRDEYMIKEISHLVGFQSESYFNRVFKKVKKISPLQYKKKNNP